MPKRQPFSLANLRDTGAALYGRGWQAALARELRTTPRTIKGWFDGKPLPDLRRYLADLCRQEGDDDPNMEKLARKLEQLSAPER
jgi:hypothetical protein